MRCFPRAGSGFAVVADDVVVRAVVRAFARAVACLVVVVVVGVVGGGCRGGGGPALVVFAASSLREPFSALAARFEAEHPGVDVVLSFAGTPELRAQLLHGAVADVFAAADEDSVRALVQTGRLADPVVFARNSVVVVARPGTITTFDALPDAARVVLGAAAVPVGRYADEVLAQAARRRGEPFAARVRAHVVSREPNVKQVLARVRLGEADAGIVYASDVVGPGAADVVVIPLPADVVVDVVHPIARVVDGPQPTLAREWIALVTSPIAQQTLQTAGFRAASASSSPSPSPSSPSSPSLTAAE
jgi:molybdate transport system substrate-binding protein